MIVTILKLFFAFKLILHYKIGFPYFREIIFQCFMHIAFIYNFVSSQIQRHIFDDHFSNPVLNIKNEEIKVRLINIRMA